MATEQKEQQQGTQPADGAKPEAKAEAKTPVVKTFTQDEVNAMISKSQSRESEARKQLKTVTKQVETLTGQLRKSQEDAEVARMAGDDEDAAKRAREVLAIQRRLEEKGKELEEREERLTVAERLTTAKLLSSQYGIPIAQLEEFETVGEMEKAAVAYENTQLKAQLKKQQEAEASAPKRPGFDTGIPKAGGTRPNWLDPKLYNDPKEFDRAAAQYKAANTRR